MRHAPSPQQAGIPAPAVMREIFQVMVKELVPLKQDAFELWTDLIDFKIGLRTIVWRKSLADLGMRRRDIQKRWVGVYEKVMVLEKLIDPDDPKAQQKLGELLSGGLLEILRQNIGEVSSLMRDIGDTARNLQTEFDVRQGIALSVTALIVAIISVAASVALSA